MRAIRLKFWLQMRVARKSVELRRVCRSLLDAEIRYLNPELLQLGENDQLDRIVEYVSRQLTGLEIHPEVEVVACEDLVFQLLGLAQKSGDVQSVIARFHAADAFLAGLLKDEERKTDQLVLARTALPELVEYDAGAIYKEYSRTVARRDEIRKLLADRSSLQINFSVSDISSGIAFITALFVVSGFLYVHYFYRQMGVEVSNYFSAADYLAVSVEQIRSGAFAAAMSLMSLLIGIVSNSRQSRLQFQARATERRVRRWSLLILTIIPVGASIITLYRGKPDFPMILIAGYLLSFHIADYIAATYFRNPLAAMTAIVGTLLFGVNVAVAAFERSEKLLNGREDSVYVQTLHYKDKDSSPAIVGELYGANSSYYFVYDRSMKVTHVVPRDRVSQIDISRREIMKNVPDQKKKEKAVAASHVSM